MAQERPVRNRSDEVECGFCMEYGRFLVDPKMLPCGDTCCTPCLETSIETKGCIPCPKCGKTFHMKIEDLPPADLTGSSTPEWCDVCLKNADKRTMATVFCVECDKKFCAAHEKSHTDLSSSHETMTIQQYSQQANKLRARYCERHTNQIIALSCLRCQGMYCVICVSGLEKCTYGEHRLMSLSEYAGQVEDESTKLRAQALDRKKQLYELEVKCEKTISEREEKLQDMIEQLHEKRDEQIKNIRETYAALERKLIEKQTLLQSEISKFLEKEVVTRSEQLSQQIEWLELKLEESHQVDLVQCHSEIKWRLQNLLSEKMPSWKTEPLIELSLATENIAGLCVKAGDCVSLSCGDTLQKSPTIDSKGELCQSQPTSLLLVNEVEIDGYCTNVKYYEGNTYLGQDDGALVMIDESGQINKRFIELRNRFAGLDIAQDRIYFSLDGYPNIVHQYDMGRNKLTNWKHTDMKGCWSSNLAIVADHVVILDKAARRVTVYTKAGEIVRHIPCDAVKGRWASICAADDHSVIISVYESSTVLRLDVDSGQIMWTYVGISGAQGVTCYQQKYVLVAVESLITTISILDLETGTSLTPITSRLGPGKHLKSCVFSLTITDDDILVVPRYADKRICFFKLTAS